MTEYSRVTYDHQQANDDDDNDDGGRVNMEIKWCNITEIYESLQELKT